MNEDKNTEEIRAVLMSAFEKAKTYGRLASELSMWRSTVAKWYHWAHDTPGKMKARPNSPNLTAIKHYLNEGSTVEFDEHNNVLNLGVAPKFIPAVSESLERRRGLMMRRIGSELYVIMQVSDISAVPSGSLIVVDGKILRYGKTDKEWLFECSSTDGKVSYKFDAKTTDVFLLIARVDQLF